MTFNNERERQAHLQAKLIPQTLPSDLEGFLSAAITGQLDRLKNIAMLAPHKLQTMIAANDFLVPWRAAAVDHLNIVKYLVEMVEPNKLDSMIVAMLPHADLKRPEILNYLFRFPAAFAYAEVYEHDFREYLTRFIKDFIAELRQRNGAEYPNIVYSEEEAHLCFYMIRYFNRTEANLNAFLEELDFLGTISVVSDSRLGIDEQQWRLKLQRNPQSMLNAYNNLHKDPLCIGKLTRDQEREFNQNRENLSKAEEQEFTKQSMIKKLVLPYLEESISGYLILKSYIEDKKFSANRTYRDRITKILPTIDDNMSNKAIAEKIRSEFRPGETVNPNGTLALILRYLDPNPGEDNLNMGRLALEQAADKLSVKVNNKKSSLEKAHELIETYITPDSFFHRHFTNRHHQQWLKRLNLYECTTAQQCYSRILHKVIVDKIDVDPQGTLAMLLNALKYLASSPEVLAENDVQMNERAPII